MKGRRPPGAGGEAITRPRRWPWLVATTLLVAGAAGPLLASTDSQASGPHPLEAAAIALVLTGCLGSAAVLVSRRADNAVAWLLPLPAVYLALGGVAELMEWLGADESLLWARWLGQDAWTWTQSAG